MNIAVINGPNLNLLGLREPEIYGRETLASLEALMRREADAKGITLSFFQSNHEGAIVDHIQSLMGKADGIIINPAAYTHTSVAILDALKAVGIPTIEVHLSQVDEREPFRQISYVREYARETIQGKGFAGYLEALGHLVDE